MTQQGREAGTWLLWRATRRRDTGHTLWGKERGWGGGCGSRRTARGHQSEVIKKPPMIEMDREISC